MQTSMKYNDKKNVTVDYKNLTMKTTILKSIFCIVYSGVQSTNCGIADRVSKFCQSNFIVCKAIIVHT